MPKILIVDDRQYVLSSVKCLLQEKGIESISANTIDEANNLLIANNDIDLIISDLVMPGITGTDFITSLKRRYPYIRVVAMSGGGDMADGSLILQEASKIADGAIKKPFTADELYDVLTNMNYMLPTLNSKEQNSDVL